MRRKTEMPNEDTRYNTDLKESILKKGGLNTQPIVPRPAKAPKGQNPESSENTQTDSNDSD